MGDRTESFDAYLREWRALHPARDGVATRIAAAYLRIPYALAGPLVRVSPNVVTLAGLLAAVATIPAYRVRALAALLVLTAGVLDSVDGAVALRRGRVTTFGAVWDSTADRLADVALLVGPALHRPGAAFAAAGAGTFLLEYIRARCQAVGLTGEQRVTPGERPTRIVVLAVAAATGWWTYGAWTVAALTLAGAALLLRDARARPTTPASG
ncbi:MAG: CDP-diacylglycerol---glycerol-3-phosphate 3-phosphatidyltransferase [Frankiaceae bacterium]|nr:CDP-diacylglycerol---glycerol-3-phosphate 3-phosphatidyltransferase [Frankiaceae bacterium]